MEHFGYAPSGGKLRCKLRGFDGEPSRIFVTYLLLIPSKIIFMAKTTILKEFWAFLKVRKKFWLAPIVIVLVLLSLLIVMTQGSALAPFIYSLF